MVTLAESFAANGQVGAARHPSWLVLNFSSGGLTLNGESRFYGYVTAPNGAVTVGGDSSLVGGLACDRLVIKGEGVLRLLARQVNQPPQVTLASPANGSAFVAPATFTLGATAVDPDGRVAKVEFYRGATKLGESSSAPFDLLVTDLAAGTYTFAARAIDDLGAFADSGSVTITVVGNQAPTVSLLAPADGTTFTAPAAITLTAVASDADGTVARVEFFRGTTKIGEDLFAPYTATVSGLAAGSYSFTARAIDHLGASVESAPVTIQVEEPNQPPAVELLAPADGSTFTMPASFTLLASASDFDGTIAKVEFFRGMEKIGERSAAPYELILTDVATGAYAFSTRAYDNRGAVAMSAAILVTVIAPNQAPVVTLTTPAGGAVFLTPATLVLSATASDPDGTIARVEFYAGTSKLGEAATAPFEFTWANVSPGARLLTARAYDNAGASATSAPRRVTISIGLPYFTGFEVADGYQPGPMMDQAGWTSRGAGMVTENLSYQGAQALLLPPGVPPVEVAPPFPSDAPPPTGFVDFFGRLAVGDAPESAVFVQTDAVRIALARSGPAGELYVFNGDGRGGGSWERTGFKVALASDGQTVAWLRVTFRGDTLAHRWDLYAEGRLVACDVRFALDSTTALSSFAFIGQSVTASVIDDLFVGFDNPLFGDADQDGMDDAWEVAHGLSAAVNDRSGDGDGDGLTNLREFMLGLRPDKFATFDDGISDGQRVNLNLSLTGPTSDNAPPTQPAGLSAKVAGVSVALTWNVSTDDIVVAGYNVYRNGEQLNSEVVREAKYADAFPGDGMSHEYTVRAIDWIRNLSPPSESIRVFVPLRDTDGNGLPDEWQLRHFGHLGVLPGGDDDGDGNSNYQEFQSGTDPTDFYNGVVPTLISPLGEFASPDGSLDLRVLKPDGSPWANAPITFRITNGYNRLSPIPGGTDFQTEVKVRSNADGLARAYLEVRS